MGGFDLLFDRHSSVATTSYLVSEGVVGSPRASLLFYDPFSAHWRFGDEVNVEDLEANAFEKKKILDASDISSHPCHACAADLSANRLLLRRKQDEQMSQTGYIGRYERNTATFALLQVMSLHYQ